MDFWRPLLGIMVCPVKLERMKGKRAMGYGLWAVGLRAKG